MEFTSSPHHGNNLCGELLVLWSDYSRGENNESSVGKTIESIELDLLLCFKNQGWSFSSISSKVFESDHELDLKGFSYCAFPWTIKTGGWGAEDMEFPGTSKKQCKCGISRGWLKAKLNFQGWPRKNICSLFFVLNFQGT